MGQSPLQEWRPSAETSVQSGGRHDQQEAAGVLGKAAGDETRGEKWHWPEDTRGLSTRRVVALSRRSISNRAVRLARQWTRCLWCVQTAAMEYNYVTQSTCLTNTLILLHIQKGRLQF